MKRRISVLFAFLSLGSLLLSPNLALAAAEQASATVDTADSADKTADKPADEKKAPASQPEEQNLDNSLSPEKDAGLHLRLSTGLNIRTDFGVHSTRLDFGARYQDFELDLVLDPMFWTNGQLHTDLLLQWHSTYGFSGFTGYRLSMIPLLDGSQAQNVLLLGLCADLPRFFGGLVQGQAGLELAMTMVKSGGGLPAEYISFESGRSYIDLVNMALFIRLNTGVDL